MRRSQAERLELAFHGIRVALVVRGAVQFRYKYCLVELSSPPSRILRES